MDDCTKFLIVGGYIALLGICICGMVSIDRHYRDKLASLGYELECHYIEVDGVRSNWCELVSIEKK